MKTPTPKVKSFLLCDQLIRATDGKYSIIGVFRRIHANIFPVYHTRFGLYMMLGEMNGIYNMTIQFVDPSSGEILGRADVKNIEYKNPLDDFETGMNLPGLHFPKAGTYEVHLIVNDELLHVDTIQAIQIEDQKNTEGKKNN